MTDANSTYNHYYSDTIQKRRQAKYKEFMMKARAKATRIQNSQDMFESVRNQISFDQDVFQDEITKSVERDMETFAAEEALESQRAIYKVPSHLQFPSKISLSTDTHTG
jgi:hypothetical protein